MELDDCDPSFINELPPFLQEVSGLIGFPATLQLAKMFGGLRFYIPAQASADHPIAKIIGLQNMAKLCAEYCSNGIGICIAMPQARRIFVAQRNKKIRGEYGPKTARQLAIEHQLSERHVERIVSSKHAKVTPPVKTRSAPLKTLPWFGVAQDA